MRVLVFVCILLMTSLSYASDVCICDPNSEFVSDRVQDYIKSVHTPNYTDNDEVIINPDLNDVLMVDDTWWVCVENVDGDYEQVREMTQEEKDIILDAIAAQADATLRIAAKKPLANFNASGVLIRALADVIKDEINILRSQHGLADRTLSQLKTAIQNRIDSKNVD